MAIFAEKRSGFSSNVKNVNSPPKGQPARMLPLVRKCVSMKGSSSFSTCSRYAAAPPLVG